MRINVYHRVSDLVFMEMTDLINVMTPCPRDDLQITAEHTMRISIKRDNVDVSRRLLHFVLDLSFKSRPLLR